MKINPNLFSKNGMIIIMLVVSIGSASFFTSITYFKEMATEYEISKTNAQGYKAFLLARAGMQGGLGALKKIPEEVLYQSGIAFNPPPVPLGNGTIFYKISPEDGKINIKEMERWRDRQKHSQTNTRRESNSKGEGKLEKTFTGERKLNRA